MGDEAYSPDARRWYAMYHTLLADMEEIERITWREGNGYTDMHRALMDIRKIARAPLQTAATESR